MVELRIGLGLFREAFCFGVATPFTAWWNQRENGGRFLTLLPKPGFSPSGNATARKRAGRTLDSTLVYTRVAARKPVKTG